MEKNLHKGFSNAAYAPREGFEESIWHCIALRQKRINNFKLCFFSGLGIISLAAFVPMCEVLLRDFTQSGFYDYVSILFSDGGGIFSYSKELTLSIVEAVPVVSIVVSLGLVFFFFLSVRYATKQIIRNQLSF